MLVGQLLLLQVDQLAERHAEDGVGLDGREGVRFPQAAFLGENAEPLFAQRPAQQGGGRLDLHQALLRLGLGRGAADHADHFVDVGVRQQQPFDRVLPLPGPAEQEQRPPADDRLAVADELLQQFLERQHPRLAVDQRQEDQRKAVLQGGELVELVEHDLGIGVALHVADQADRLVEVALVVHRGNAGDLSFIGQRGDPLLDPVARLLEGDFRDHDAKAIAVFLDGRPAAEHDRAAAGVIAAADAGPAADHPAGRKIGPGHDFQQLVDRDLRLVDHPHQRIADFAQVVRRQRRGHAHRDAVGPVHQQVRELRRQHGRLGPPLVVGRQVIDRVELQILHQHRGDVRHAGFRVPHGRRRQARDRPKIALLIDQQVSHVPLLGHAYQGRINHRLAVGMIVAAGVAGDLGALHPAGTRRQVQIVHGHQNPPLRGLQPVARVRQRPADDHAHRVGEITALELVLDGQLDQLLGGHRDPALSGGSRALRLLGFLRFIGRD